MDILPYDLRAGGTDSDRFYKLNSIFSQAILRKGYLEFGGRMNDYQKWLQVNDGNNEQLYRIFLDFLTIGVLWNEHAAKAMESNAIAIRLLRITAGIRHHFPQYKKYLDRLKGRLLPWIIKNRENSFRIPSFNNLLRIIRWLQATGEYTLEAERLDKWAKYCKALSTTDFYDINRSIIDFSSQFIQQAEKLFGSNFQQYDQFLEMISNRNPYREDAFLVKRGLPEYFLNLTGASIINSAQAPEFSETSQKLIIVPACMCKSKRCMASQSEYGLHCNQCHSACPVNKLSSRFESKNVQVFIVPHTSDYMKLVSALPRESTGVVGVACALNLLEGGYALLRKGFSAQCVYLDFCGCRNHWSEQGKVTEINEGQVQFILNYTSKRTLAIRNDARKTVA